MNINYQAENKENKLNIFSGDAGENIYLFLFFHIL